MQHRIDRRVQVARENPSNAGVLSKVQLLVGLAVDTLVKEPEPFDLVFIDADKPSNAIYFK